MAPRWTTKIQINGGIGFDTVVLNGNYSGGLTFGKNTLQNVETIVLSPGNNYKIITHNATVAKGASLVIDASALGAINSATVNASAEKSSQIIFLGGAGNDVFTGGKGAAMFFGGTGADIMSGGKGADFFQYGHVADSPLQTIGGLISVSGDDQILGFQVGSDKIDLSSLLLPGAAQSVVTKSTTGFSADLANGAGYFGAAGVAVEYAGPGKSVAARVYVDTNHDGNLGAGDMLIQVTGVASDSLKASAFNF